jgi:hypothetical protein
LVVGSLEDKSTVKVGGSAGHHLFGIAIHQYYRSKLYYLLTLAIGDYTTYFNTFRLGKNGSGNKTKEE